MHELSLLHDLVLIFAAAIAVSLVGTRIGLPSLAGMIIAGALIGPHGFGLVGDLTHVQALAEVGVVLLLFGVGSELPFDRLRQLFRPMVVGGSLQVLLTGAVGFGLSRAAGLNTASALLIGFVVAPSSTAIVLRRLHARGEVEAPHGRQMLGILLFQDLCVVPMMLVLPALGAQSAHGPLAIAGELARSLGVLVLVVAAARFVAPKLLHAVTATRQRDVFVLAVFVVVIGTAWAASLAGVSLALGAFLAGVVISGSEYRHQALGELMPFREVFASLFFVTAGMLLDAGRLLHEPAGVLGLFALLVVLKALIVLLLCAALGLALRPSFLTALGLAQVGEFALVLLDRARGAQVLESGLESTLRSAAILSMIATPLLAAAAPRVAAFAERSAWLRRRWQGVAAAAGKRAHDRAGHVVIAGYGVAGKALARQLAGDGLEPLIVDLNANLVREAVQDGFAAYFGDVTLPEVLEQLRVAEARELVLLISDPSALERAVALVRRVAPHVIITVRARYEGEIPALQAHGADHVVAAEIEAGRAITAQVVRRNSRRPS